MFYVKSNYLIQVNLETMSKQWYPQIVTAKLAKLSRKLLVLYKHNSKSKIFRQILIAKKGFYIFLCVYN